MENKGERTNRGFERSQFVGSTEICIGIGLILCLFLTGLFPQIQRLAACTGVLMCTQDVSKGTWKSGLIRLEGVLCGGGTAVIVVIIDDLVGIDPVFYVLCGIGIVINLLLCSLLHMPKVTGRVSGITFILVAFLAQGNGRLFYAVNRLIGTLVGALAALLLTALWELICRKRAQE